MPQTKESFVKGRTTQFVLTAYRRRGSAKFWAEIDNEQCTGTNLSDKTCSFFYTWDELKAELAKRPHVSHKRERRVLRQTKNERHAESC